MPETMPSVGVPAIILMITVFLAILLAWIGVVLRLAFGFPVLPPRTPRYVPWGAGSVVLAVLGWLGLQIFVPTFYLIFAHPKVAGAVQTDLTPSEQMTLSAAMNALILILIPLGLALSSGARPRDFGFDSKTFGLNVFRGIVAYPLLAPLVFGMMIISLLIWNKTPHPLEDALKFGQNPMMLVVLSLAAVVFAPIAEELIFRGVLLGWLTRVVLGRPKPLPVEGFLDEPQNSTLADLIGPDPGFVAGFDRDSENPYAAPVAHLIAPMPTVSSISGTKVAMLVLSNVVVSIIFGGLHAAAWPTPIPLFFLSLGLGVLYQRTGSLVPPIALHMTFNGVSTALMLLTLGANPVPKLDAKSKDEPKPKVEIKELPVTGLNFFPKRNH